MTKLQQKCAQCKKMRAENKRLQSELTIQQGEVVEARRLIANMNPDHLVNSLPDTLKEYSPDLIKAVLAQGMVGALPDEMRAALGLMKDDWMRWRIEFPEFGRAANRYVTLARSFWLTSAREAIQNGNWQFNHDKVHKMLATAFKGEDLEADGDASKLVHIDLGGPVPDDVRKIGHNKPSTLK